MASYVKQLAKKFHFRVEVIEVDIRYSSRADFTQLGVQRKWLSFISKGGADALLVTPPCSTFSRAHWANDEGPLPLRSQLCPRGFTWNSKGRQFKAWQGSTLADFSFGAMEAQLSHPDRVAIIRPRVPGHQPASMWQWPQHEALAALPGVDSLVLAQVDFGSTSPKPTRLLLRVPGPLHSEMYVGPPQFDTQGFYTGPLPRKEGTPLIGKHKGVYRTAAAAEWPPPLCKWAAQQILLSFQKTSEARGKQEDKGSSKKRQREEEELVPRKRQREEEELVPRQEEKRSRREEGLKAGEEGHIDPLWPKFPGGKGPARTCDWKGNEVPFHDGGCLQSPGRWNLDQRNYPEGVGWQELRRDLVKMVMDEAGGEAKLEKECFAMAKGGESFRLAKDEQLLERIRTRLWEFCGSPEGVLEVPEGQPFWLALIRCMLEKAGDPDTEFLREAEEGLPLGVKHPLPRTPQSFERQTEWALESDPTLEWGLAKGNYPSASEHEDHLRDHLEGEVREGLMEKMTAEAFEQRFKEDRAIAALAVLVEDEVTGKKRVIHDGTHGINVNRRIKSLDKLRMPGGREKRFLLKMFRGSGDLAFSLIGDFGKAHRRFKYRSDEHGFLGCVVKESEGIVYVNKVGTFGISSTPYWWGRISGALIRLTHALIGPGVPVEMLLYADDLETMGIGPPGRRGSVMVFVLMAALGSPFKWAKQRGGLQTEWIGLLTDYGTYSYGISEKRSDWLVQWIGSLCREKMVVPREFMAGLGRLWIHNYSTSLGKALFGPALCLGCSGPEPAGEGHDSMGCGHHLGLDCEKAPIRRPNGTGSFGLTSEAWRSHDLH